MTGILILRERLREFYKKNVKFIAPIGKFILAFAVLMIINTTVPFFPQINNIIVVLVISAVCAFLHINFTCVCAGIVLLLNTYKASVELAVVIALLFMIMIIFYFRFSSREAVILLFMPIAFVLKIPFCIPIIMGLTGGLLSIIPVCFAGLLCYIAGFAGANAAALTKAHSLTTIEKFQFISQRIFVRPEMSITLLAFAATIIVVYFVRRLDIDYAWLISVLSGSLVSVVVVLLGYMLINNYDDTMWLVFGEVVSACIGVFAQFMYFPLDYSRVERMQFEDDEYYYYLKAVPKMSVIAPSVTIKRFTKEGAVSERGRDVSEDAFLDEFEKEFIKDTDSKMPSTRKKRKRR
ncbi:MAG: hypothetical protein IK152_04090 [Lachnospiraceae bacterium]|nr:hypothetical protein [Lachnospiraceae bacterium]